jgi:leucyl/phenylalanyl-tRNA--protein transferase
LLLLEIPFPGIPPLPHPLYAVEKGDQLLFSSDDLDPDFILFAYANGIFPWGGDVRHYWWFTAPRFVLQPGRIHVGRQMRKLLREFRGEWHYDTQFDAVLDYCATVRRGDQADTWINEEYKQVFMDLHRRGWAHSVEICMNGELVGGLYGLAMGKVFFGESMFHLQSGASKLAFYYLCQTLVKRGFQLIDCQMKTPLLESFGAEFLSGKDYFRYLKANWCSPAGIGSWKEALYRINEADHEGILD